MPKKLAHQIVPGKTLKTRNTFDIERDRSDMLRLISDEGRSLQYAAAWLRANREYHISDRQIERDWQAIRPAAKGLKDPRLSLAEMIKMSEYQMLAAHELHENHKKIFADRAVPSQHLSSNLKIMGEAIDRFTRLYGVDTYLKSREPNTAISAVHAMGLAVIDPNDGSRVGESSSIEPTPDMIAVAKTIADFAETENARDNDYQY